MSRVLNMINKMTLNLKVDYFLCFSFSKDFLGSVSIPASPKIHYQLKSELQHRVNMKSWQYFTGQDNFCTSGKMPMKANHNAVRIRIWSIMLTMLHYIIQWSFFCRDIPIPSLQVNRTNLKIKNTKLIDDKERPVWRQLTKKKENYEVPDKRVDEDICLWSTWCAWNNSHYCMFILEISYLIKILMK
jgi:hypothetical protein